MKDLRIEDKLCNFIKDYCDDLNTLQLLLFFSRHPNAHFNRSALTQYLDSRHFDAGTSLKKLMEKKIIVVKQENGIHLYSLTREETSRGLALQMLTIDQAQWQIVLEQILDAHDIPE